MRADVSNSAAWHVLMPTLHLLKAHPEAFEPWRAATDNSFVYTDLSGGSFWFQKVAS